MGTPIAPAKLNIGDKVKDTWIVKKKLGEGSCGMVFLVQSVKLSGPEGKAAMKVEPFMKSKDDEILKMEVFVLKKVQKSKHACKLLMAGKDRNFSFLIMSLLGKELSELRRRYYPDRKMGPVASLRVGVQALQAIRDLHSVGFVHRDVKPTNFACGHANRHIIYMFDYGLSRQIMTNEGGKLKLREPREKVSFRGTVRYCSLNVHLYKEQGRHDDLWSILFMCIELCTATLPWKGMSRKESGAVKANVTDAALCKDCPPSFMEITKMLKSYEFKTTPAYDTIKGLLMRDIQNLKGNMNDPFEWEKTDKKVEKKNEEKDHDEKAEIDQSEDTDTKKDLEESVESQASDDESQTKGFAKEDTLDNVAEMNNNKSIETTKK
ncbi:unnamed protein product [Bursaphelenchus okinawaensis]|uniref:Protein kinase domain-containing protein n=1 Tax=Bursaphelenchus okinawaensis TaxID=465554 RepID=A0A811L566_9BILA|nr:unnamed protein product [Bursaphelenchus okinawaensis]CAG9117755.1 unnamed protein product [Bursaphelenchus okinawaensis]